MKTQYSLQGRAEYLIAASRMVLAAFFLFAIWVDPSEPSEYADVAYTILAGYLVYAVILGLVSWSRPVSRGRLPVVTHTFDFIVFSALMFLTKGPTSPFFVSFVFLLVCATLRWQWRGTLWTALVALSMVMIMAFYPAALASEPGFELNRIIIRVIYLAVVAVLLGYLGAHEEKMRSDLANLAAWPRQFSTEYRPLMQEILEQAAAILEAPRTVLLWEEEEEPWLHVATWSSGNFLYNREATAEFGSLVASPLAGTNFFCPDAAAAGKVFLSSAGTAFTYWQGEPLDGRLRERFAIRSVLALRLQGNGLAGYLLALDQSQGADALALGAIVAREITTRLENLLFLSQLREAAALDERIRLARDLHDGLLQSLTGLALQLEIVHRRLATEPDAARLHLRDIQQLIVDEQRDLRAHIQQLRPASSRTSASRTDLAVRLEEMAGRMKRHWSLDVEVNFKPTAFSPSQDLAREIYFLIHEATINAARHANASEVLVSLDMNDDCLLITVTDNGQGFPFQGLLEQDSLQAMGCGPVTLRERTTALHGTLTIDSGDTGSRVEISLPLPGSLRI